MTKYKKGQTVLYKGKEEQIRVTHKDFSTGKARYELEPTDKDPYKTGVMVDEVDIKLFTTIEPTPETVNVLEQLHIDYRKQFGKAVPNNKKNNELWIVQKVESATVQKSEIRETLKLLGWDGLENLIDEKELDIDINDYSNQIELLQAVCEELGIE